MTHYWLLPTVQISRSDATLSLYDGVSGIEFSSEADTVARLLTKLDGSHGVDIDSTSFGRQLVALLDKRSWIVRLENNLKDFEQDFPERTRQLSYLAHVTRKFPDCVFADLAAKSALIVGVGGIGSYAAYHLAASGLGRVVLNDPDVVESTNFNRQIFCRAGTQGLPKPQLVADELRGRFPHVTVDVEVEALSAERLRDAANKVDLVIVAGEATAHLDSPEVIGETPIVFAGYFGQRAFVGPALSPRHGSPSWPQFARTRERPSQSRLQRTRVPRERGWNSSGSAINAVGGALLGEVSLRLLTERLGPPLCLGSRRFIDMAKLDSIEEESVL